MLAKKQTIFLGISGIFLIFIIIFSIIKWESIYNRGQLSFYQLTQQPPKVNLESEVQTFTFDSPSLNVAKEIKVYLPPHYQSTGARKFPVLYLFHGYPGTNADWLLITHIQYTLDMMIQDGSLGPCIVVFPDTNGSSAATDSQFLNAVKIDQPMEDFIVKDLVSYIDSHYNTQPDRFHRALGGISSGAYGAVNIGLHNNNMFAFMISHSGYFINREESTQKLLGDNAKAREYNNPLDYITHINLNPQTYLYMDIGDQDEPIFIKDNQNLDTTLTQKNLPHIFLSTPGTHSWPLWGKNIKSSLVWLGTYWR